MKSLCWKWRLSRWSKPYYALKTFLFIQWNARKIALELDHSRNILGQIAHSTSKKEMGNFVISNELRSELLRGANKSLPNGWEWR